MDEAPDLPADLDQWNELFRSEFAKESDRACVLLSASLLELAIDVLLKAGLRPCPTSKDPLFDGINAPIGTFCTKIDMAYRLGMIDEKLSRGLHLIRRIRNRFAHEITECSFANPAVLDQLAELKTLSGLPEYVRGKALDYEETARGHFQMIVSWYQWIIRSWVVLTKPVDRPAVPGHFRKPKQEDEDRE